MDTATVIVSSQDKTTGTAGNKLLAYKHSIQAGTV